MGRIAAENTRLLCLHHNLEKSGKITRSPLYRAAAAGGAGVADIEWASLWAGGGENGIGSWARAPGCYAPEPGKMREISPNGEDGEF